MTAAWKDAGRATVRTAVVAFVAAAAFAAETPSFRTLYEGGVARAVVERILGGGEDADDDHALYGVAALALDDAGNVFITDYKLHCIKKFSPQGEHLLTYVREGEGPGDLRDPVCLTVNRSGRVTVWDRGNRRFSVFDGDFEPIATADWHVGRSGFGRIVASPDGRFYATISELEVPPTSGMYALRLVELDEDFRLVRTLDSLRVRRSFVLTSEAGVTFLTAPMQESLVWGVLPDGGVAVARSGSYRVRVLSPSGEPVTNLARDVRGPEVTREDREEYFARFQSAVQDEARRVVRFPERKPVLTGIWTDAEGYLLVGVEKPRGAPPTFDVFDPAGRYVGEVADEDFPEDAVFGRDGFLDGVRRSSEEELPAVCRFRLEAKAR